MQRAQVKCFCKRKSLCAEQRTVGLRLSDSSSFYPAWAAKHQPVAARARPFLPTVNLYEPLCLASYDTAGLSKLQYNSFPFTQSSVLLLFVPVSAGLTWWHHDLPTDSSNLQPLSPRNFRSLQLYNEFYFPEDQNSHSWLCWNKYLPGSFKQFYKCLQGDKLWTIWRKFQILRQNNNITP